MTGIFWKNPFFMLKCFLTQCTKDIPVRILFEVHENKNDFKEAFGKLALYFSVKIKFCDDIYLNLK